MRRLLAPITAVLLLTGAWSSPASAASDVEVRFTADKQEITLGEPARLSLEVVHPAGYQVIFPKLPRAWGDFEVRSQSRTQINSSGQGEETTSQVVEVTLFALGTFETPELPITFRDSVGLVGDRLAPTVSLTVVSVLSEGDTELRDIRAQAELPILPAWITGVMVALGALLAAGVIYPILRRRSSQTPVPVPIGQVRSPFEIAMDELERIERLDLPGRQIYKEHSSLISDCLRRYLEAAYEAPLLERTTDEIRLALRKIAINPSLSSETIELLGECDLVKFAKFGPGAEAAREYTTRARKLVQLARPAPAFQSESGATAAGRVAP